MFQHGLSPGVDLTADSRAMTGEQGSQKRSLVRQEDTEVQRGQACPGGPPSSLPKPHPNDLKASHEAPPPKGATPQYGQPEDKVLSTGWPPTAWSCHVHGSLAGTQLPGAWIFVRGHKLDLPTPA